MADTEWLGKANCRREDVKPDWWFPEEDDHRTRDAAKALCRQCPVRSMCAKKWLEDYDRGSHPVGCVVAGVVVPDDGTESEIVPYLQHLAKDA